MMTDQEQESSAMQASQQEQPEPQHQQMANMPILSSPPNNINRNLNRRRCMRYYSSERPYSQRERSSHVIGSAGKSKTNGAATVLSTDATGAGVPAGTRLRDMKPNILNDPPLNTEILGQILQKLKSNTSKQEILDILKRNPPIMVAILKRRQQSQTYVHAETILIEPAADTVVGKSAATGAGPGGEVPNITLCKSLKTNIS